MPKRGLSVDEKRDKMLEFFYEHKDFYLLKDLERLCPKEKGIISQSVKDIVQQLVSDNFVDTDKIGTSTYFWAFPSKAGQKLKSQLEDLKVQLGEAEKKEKKLQHDVVEAKKGREGGEEREALLQSLESAKRELDKVQQELAAYRENDPATFEQMKEDSENAVTAANRWTDNLFAMKKWLTSKYNIDEQTINKQFGLPEEVDYL